MALGKEGEFVVTVAVGERHPVQVAAEVHFHTWHRDGAGDTGGFRWLRGDDDIIQGIRTGFVRVIEADCVGASVEGGEERSRPGSIVAPGVVKRKPTRDGFIVNVHPERTVVADSDVDGHRIKTGFWDCDRFVYGLAQGHLGEDGGNYDERGLAHC
jgi:hypothetical protein